MTAPSAAAPPGTPRHGLARVISKMGVASRSQASRWILEGRVRVNGALVLDPEFSVRQGVDRVEVHGTGAIRAPRLVVMLNKPRGLVTTTSDEQDRDTVYRCFAGSKLPWIAPVGRLDKASEGLLLFSNDPVWAARITEPESGPDKTYHVQVNYRADDELLERVVRGAFVDGEHLAAKSARCLRVGTRNAWLEVVLAEGRNRQIRRLLSAFGVSVLRLVRVAIGPLELGELKKGEWRILGEPEVASL